MFVIEDILCVTHEFSDENELVKFLQYQNPSSIFKINTQLLAIGKRATNYGTSLSLVDIPKVEDEIFSDNENRMIREIRL
ncbi:MAG: hypothetical protein PHE67_00500 [Campylobacterales bacterium]|nr:hypothetical protein [Campylobacterales bacterium]